AGCCPAGPDLARALHPAQRGARRRYRAFGARSLRRADRVLADRLLRCRRHPDAARPRARSGHRRAADRSRAERVDARAGQPELPLRGSSAARLGRTSRRGTLHASGHLVGRAPPRAHAMTARRYSLLDRILIEAEKALTTSLAEAPPAQRENPGLTEGEPDLDE